MKQMKVYKRVVLARGFSFVLVCVCFLAIELPSTPLDTDGPALEHLGKSRPKPARMQRSTRRGGGPPPSKPSALAAAAIAETVPEDKPILEAKPKPKEKVNDGIHI